MKAAKRRSLMVTASAAPYSAITQPQSGTQPLQLPERTGAHPGRAKPMLPPLRRIAHSFHSRAQWSSASNISERVLPAD